MFFSGIFSFMEMWRQQTLRRENSQEPVEIFYNIPIQEIEMEDDDEGFVEGRRSIHGRRIQRIENIWR